MRYDLMFILGFLNIIDVFLYFEYWGVIKETGISVNYLVRSVFIVLIK